MTEAAPAAGTSYEQLLATLTDHQLQAVTHVEGPLLVVAGPGSGKTRTIICRIAHLIRAAGIAPWNVLAITFTNKAAGEMRDRLTGVLSSRQAAAVTCSTFHSFCARLLRKYAERIGLDRSYSIYDSADQKRAIIRALENLEISPKNFSPGNTLGTISNAKNELQSAKAFAAQASGFYDTTVARIYHKYQQILKQNNALDFDDLLLRTVELLRTDEQVLTELRERFQHILIDEYQDTNHAQFVIVNALAGDRHNICATGDPDQSIYRWRGADLRNILEFERHYPAAKVVRLEQNYRSSPQILAVADRLIQANRHRKHKALWTDNAPGEPVRVVTCPNEHEEARAVVEAFCELHDSRQVRWGKMAVFYRTNSLSRVIEDELRNSGIPYQIARGTAFYDRKEIKDALAYLRVISNPDDEINLLRIINLPARGISAKTVKAMQARAAATGAHLPKLLTRIQEIPALPSRATNAVRLFAAQLDRWRSQKESIKITLRAFVEQVLRESKLEVHHARDSGDPDQDRLMNLSELVNSAQQFEDDLALDDEIDQVEAPLGRRLETFLERISLVSDVDAVDSTQGAITLMTLHAAKGLEFSAVAVVGLEDGLLPHHQALGNEIEMEEERRLCFVGITRAADDLVLLHARCRSVFGQVTPTMPSRFLSELDPQHLCHQDRTDPLNDPYEQRAQQTTEDQALYPPGTCVRHPQFGVGRILSVSPAGDRSRARVEFADFGVKTLLLQYARLEIVS